MTTTTKVYNQEGKGIGQVKLDPQIFTVPIKEPVVQQVVVTQLANARQNLAHTKTRGEVRGGGKKPWRQKGTGRARHGSIRSPLWRGGGVTFGPTKFRNYSQKINKSTKRLATRMVLTDKAQNKAIVVLDQLQLADYKTKEMVKILQKLPVKNKSSLLILPKADDKISRSTRNLKEINTILADSLNVVALLKYDWLIIIKDSLKKISEIYGK